MTQITYANQTKPNTGRARIAVRVAGRLAGHILGTFDGRFAYQPKGTTIYGNSFRTLEACKASLEGEE